jgi:putative two-component system response regulator
MIRPSADEFHPEENDPPRDPAEGTSSPSADEPADLPLRRPIVPELADARIAIVDDEPLNIQVVQKYLHDAGYRRFITTSQPATALELLRRERPDLVLLDIMMPGVSGLEILRALKADQATCRIPVLILTVVSDARVKYEAINLGAADFLNKPVDPHEVVPRVRNALVAKMYQDELARENLRLEREIERRVAELARSRRQVVYCLARAAEYRDDDTGRHVLRVGLYAGLIARELGFDDAYVELLEMAAQLHDLGKIAIPDSILHHPGKLSPEQVEQMRTHCGIAKKIMQPLAEEEWRILRTHVARQGRRPARAPGTRQGFSDSRAYAAGYREPRPTELPRSSLLMLATTIAQTHHEWWDGSGYPLGLAGDDIPIEGRMTAVADVYDALSSRRPYKFAYAPEKCFSMLAAKRGTHFDPDVLDAFCRRKDDVARIQKQYMDAE